MCNSGLTLDGYIWYITIPPVAVLMLLGSFILFSNIKKSINIIYFLIMLFLGIWALADAASFKLSNPVYVNIADRISSLGLVAAALIVLFLHVFPEGKKLNSRISLLIMGPLGILLAFVPTSIYIKGTGQTPACETVVGPIFNFQLVLLVYYILLGIYISLKKIKNLSGNEKKQFRLFMIGSLAMIFFGIIIDVVPTITKEESIILFTPYSTMLFAIVGAYAIVKYKAFMVKVVAAQVFTVVTWVLIGSQLFFAHSGVNRILIGITLVFSIVFGYVLIKSIRDEVERKEQLQAMADKLAMANEELKKLDNAKTEFLSIASHQLRTPLTAIKGFVSLILEGAYGKVEPEMRGALNKISISSERLIQLVEDLLNVSRIESGRMQYRFEQSRVEPLLSDLCENFALVAKQRDLYLDLKLPKKDLPELNMDPAKMREVLSNLIDNALKYTEKGGVTVRAESFLAIDSKTKKSDVVRLTISDTGIGIPAEEIPYLFQKFSRGKDTKRLHVGGTGLGLYVGKNIVEAHGGQIWIESDGAGRGTKFVIEIPAAVKS